VPLPRCALLRPWFKSTQHPRTEVAMDDAQGVEVVDSTAQLPSDVLQA
jgi:hypothetical protein